MVNFPSRRCTSQPRHRPRWPQRVFNGNPYSASKSASERPRICGTTMNSCDSPSSSSTKTGVPRLMTGPLFHRLSLHPSLIILWHDRSWLRKPLLHVNARIQKYVAPRIERSGPNDKLRFVREQSQNIRMRYDCHLSIGKDAVDLLLYPRIVLRHLRRVSDLLRDELAIDRGENRFDVRQVRYHGKINTRNLAGNRKTCVTNDKIIAMPHRGDCLVEP